MKYLWTLGFLGITVLAINTKTKKTSNTKKQEAVYADYFI